MLLSGILSRNHSIVITDHKNLEYFNTTRNFSRRQVRWAEILADFSFVLQYPPARHSAAADSLSGRDRPLLGGGEDTPRGKTRMVLLIPEIFLNTITALPLAPSGNDLLKQITEDLPGDTHFGPIFQGAKNTPDVEGIYTVADDLLFYKGLICVPDSNDIKRKILEEYHDAPAAGHFGIAKTFEIVSRNYYWPSMRKYIKDYISGCDTCIRNKNHHHKPYGLLAPLP